jgi:hypothetical protein
VFVGRGSDRSVKENVLFAVRAAIKLHAWQHLRVKAAAALRHNKTQVDKTDR